MHDNVHKKHNFSSFILRKIAYLWVSYHLFLYPLTISSTSNIQGYTYMSRTKFDKYDIDHTDDTDIVINTNDWIIPSGMINQIVYICKYVFLYEIWLSVKRSLWVLHGLIVWRLFYCWHTVTVMLKNNLIFNFFFYFSTTTCTKHSDFTKWFIWV